MSKATEIAYENAQKSVFRFTDNHTIEVENASILWPDFTGRVTPYHKVLGEKRTFNLVLNDAMLQALAEWQTATGVKFNIHPVNVYSDNDVKVKGVQQIVMYYINVKVNMDNEYPPIVKLFTTYGDKKSSCLLNRDTIGQLDAIDIEEADIVLNCYTSQMHPDCCSAYLKKAYVIQSPQVPDFGGKFDDWDNAEGEITPADVVNAATGDMML